LSSWATVSFSRRTALLGVGPSAVSQSVSQSVSHSASATTNRTPPPPAGLHWPANGLLTLHAKSAVYFRTRSVLWCCLQPDASPVPGTHTHSRAHTQHSVMT